MANGFQSEVRFVHATDILFVRFKFMFLTYGMSVRHYISEEGVYALFSNKKIRGKHALGNLQIVFNQREKIVLLMKVSPSWCF